MQFSCAALILLAAVATASAVESGSGEADEPGTGKGSRVLSESGNLKLVPSSQRGTTIFVEGDKEITIAGLVNTDANLDQAIQDARNDLDQAIQDARNDAQELVKVNVDEIDDKIDALDATTSATFESVRDVATTDRSAASAAAQINTDAVKINTDALSAAQQCGAKSSFYSGTGCVEIPVSTTKFTADSKCDSSNEGEITYAKWDGELCVGICTNNVYTFLAGQDGGLGGRCNPFASCAAVADAKKPSGVYQFVKSQGVTEKKYCDVKTKKLHEWYYDSRIPENGLIAWWDAMDYTEGSKAWPARIGAFKGKSPTFENRLPKRTKGGPEAHANHVSIQGDSYYDRIKFGNICPKSTWTMCTTSRYDTDNGRRKGRIFIGSGSNWLFGHWGSRAGSYYMNGWRGHTMAQSDPGQEAWVVSCMTNGGDNGVWMNKKSKKATRVNSANGARRPNEVGIGWRGGSGWNERSSYMMGTVISWNRHFSKQEMTDITQYMIDHLNADPEA